MVGHVDRCVNTFEDHEIAFDPFTEGEVFNIYVTGSGGGFLCIAHRCAAIVVFEEDRSRFLWHVEIPEDASDEKDHFSSVVCRHKFSLSGRSRDRGEEFALVGDGSAGESNASASKGATGFHTCGPVGVCVGMGGSRVKLWASVEKYILSVASNAREWAFREFHTRGSAPEVDTIVFRVVEEFQCMLQGVVM